ncbi:MAG: ATP-binding protein, partial [Ignavibacteriaceae bacterium]
MKISYRILIVNFAIVGLILVSSAAAFYSLIYGVLTSQQSKHLLHSASNFNVAYRQAMQGTEDDFLFLANNEKNILSKDSELSERNIDFIFEAVGDSSNELNQITSNSIVYIPKKKISINQFLDYNPHAVIKSYKTNEGKLYYYGRILTGDFLSELSKKIGCEIAIIWNNTPSELSNPLANEKNLFLLGEIYEKLSTKKNYEVYIDEGNSSDIIASLVTLTSNFEKSNNLKFLIYANLTEGAELRTSLLHILIIIGIAGIILSLILSYVFTDKIRKQISELNNATKLTKGGNFKNKITFKSKDELGELASAFNIMIDELEKNQKARNEYSDFISLINQNPTLNEISDAALSKIIKACDFTVGALYLIDGNEIKLASSHGWKTESNFQKKSEFFEIVLKTNEELEINFDSKSPVISTGIVDLEIKNIFIIPIIYNNKIIALLELGSIKKPGDEAKDYLKKIKQHLAIGLVNASTLVQLENFVAELKKLNDEYQQQNKKIKKQNEDLVLLHNELRGKAEELKIQKLKAEEATTLKSQFLASMSHELRTPMNSILGLTELIHEDQSINGKNKERLEVVRNSGKRLMRLINEILDLSKIEAGKMEINEEPIILSDLINEIETFVIPLVSLKNVAYKTVTRLEKNNVFKTDRVKIMQILLNLIGNAVKFTPEGSIELEILLKDEKLIFKIKDTGIGISEENQKIIFEEFRQLDGSTTRKYSGTGLGLTISKKIADLLKGSIELVSEEGKGSIFIFSVPFNFVEMRKKIQEKNIKASDQIPFQNSNTVLLIDDNSSVSYTIAQYLNSKGYQTEFAQNGKNGVQKANKLK